jgi:hypothetical protein
MHNFVHVMLHNSPAAQKIESLWLVRFFRSVVSSITNYLLLDCQEYEAGQTNEARFVKGNCVQNRFVNLPCLA